MPDPEPLRDGYVLAREQIHKAVIELLKLEEMLGVQAIKVGLAPLEQEEPSIAPAAGAPPTPDAAWLEDVLGKHGLTRKALADLSGLSPELVWKIASGRQRMTRPVRSKIVQSLAQRGQAP